MHLPFALLLALAVMPAYAADAQADDRCGRAVTKTVNGKATVYMGTIERSYRVCTTSVATPTAKRLNVIADGTTVASLPTNKGGSGQCVDVGGKRIEVSFDQDDFPVVYYAVSAVVQ